MRNTIAVPASIVALQASHASGAYIALAGLAAFVVLVATGAISKPAEPGPTVAAVDGALDVVAPVLVPMIGLWMLWSCVDRARQADPRLGAALLFQQVWAFLAIAAGLGSLALAVWAGFSGPVSLLLAMVAGPMVAGVCDGLLERLQTAALERWGAAQTGRVRVMVDLRGTPEEVREALLSTAKLIGAAPMAEPAEPLDTGAPSA